MKGEHLAKQFRVLLREVFGAALSRALSAFELLQQILVSGARIFRDRTTTVRNKRSVGDQSKHRE